MELNKEELDQMKIDGEDFSDEFMEEFTDNYVDDEKEDNND